MMQTMRNPKVLKAGLWIIIILIIPSFVLFYGYGGSNPSGGGRAPKTVFAKVQTDSGTHKIGPYEIQASENELANHYLSLYRSFTQQQPDRAVVSQVQSGLTHRQIAEHAVSMVAFDDLANKNDLIVSDKQVEKMLSDAGLTDEQFRDMLKMQGKSEAQFLQEARFDLRNSRMEALVGSLAKASLLELWLEYKLANDRLKVEYVKAPVSNYLDEVQVEEADLQKYYDQHKSEYVKPKERVYKYVLRTPPPRANTEIEVTDEEVQKLYDAPGDATIQRTVSEEPGRIVRHIMVQSTDGDTSGTAQQKAEAVLKLLKEGKDFAEVARLENRDVATPVGGLVANHINDENKGTYSTKYGSAWVDAVMSMDGSEGPRVVESGGSWFVVKVDGVSTGKQPLEKVRLALEAHIRKQKADAEQAARRKEIERLQKEMQEQVASRTTIDSVARALELEVRETSPTLASVFYFEQIGELGSSREAVADLAVGEMTPVMAAGGTENLVVMQLASEIPERGKTLDEVRSLVDSSVRREKAADRAHEEIEKLAERVRAGDAMTSAALEFKLAARDTKDPFTRSSPPSDLQFVENFANRTLMAKPGDLFVLRSAIGTTMTESWVAIRLVSKEEPDKEKFLKEMQPLELGISYAKQRLFVNEFRRDAVKNLKVEYDEEYVRDEDDVRRRSRGG